MWNWKCKQTVEIPNKTDDFGTKNVNKQLNFELKTTSSKLTF